MQYGGGPPRGEVLPRQALRFSSCFLDADGRPASENRPGPSGRTGNCPPCLRANIFRRDRMSICIFGLRKGTSRRGLTDLTAGPGGGCLDAAVTAAMAPTRCPRRARRRVSVCRDRRRARGNSRDGSSHDPHRHAQPRNARQPGRSPQPAALLTLRQAFSIPEIPCFTRAIHPRGRESGRDRSSVSGAPRIDDAGDSCRDTFVINS